MKRVMGQILVVLSLVVTLVWSGADSHVLMEASTGGVVSGLGIGHSHDAGDHKSVEPSHLAHHGCHNHLTSETDAMVLAQAVRNEGRAYIVLASSGLSGRAVGPSIKPPAVA